MFGRTSGSVLSWRTALRAFRDLGKMLSCDKNTGGAHQKGCGEQELIGCRIPLLTPGRQGVDRSLFTRIETDAGGHER
jgi:hypothetical protein